MAAVTACRICGIEPLENARFCHGCGSAVAEADTHAEYKQVTVLFADVVHSMDIAAAVGPERLREIMAELVNRATVVVQRYGGTVDKFTGDGLMAVFGAPIALEDHAFRACLAALGIQSEAERLAVKIQDRDGVDLQLRVGLNSGQVIAGEIGSGPLGYTAVGEHVGMAQRMESVAPPGRRNTTKRVHGAISRARHRARRARVRPYQRRRRAGARISAAGGRGTARAGHPVGHRLSWPRLGIEHGHGHLGSVDQRPRMRGRRGGTGGHRQEPARRRGSRDGASPGRLPCS